MAKQVAKKAEPTATPSVPPTKIKKVRQVQPPRRATTPYDPKDYDLEDEPVETAETAGEPEAPSQSAPVAEPIAPASATVPSKPAQSPRLVRMAAELGITSADIEGLTNEQLTDEIVLAQRQMLAFQENERRMAPRGDLHPAPPPVVEDDLELHPETDPQIAAALKKLAKENKELKDTLAKASEREQRREAESRNERIDRTFQGLTDYANIFGKGRLGELSTEELACRQAVLTVAEADQSKAPFEAKIVKAVKTLYRQPAAPPPAPKAEEPYEQPAAKPTNGTTYEEEELAKRRAVWNAATVAEPTNRKGAPEPKSLSKAKKTYLKGLQEIGQGDELANELVAELPD